jgi:type II secretory pathway pseudopilin PulG
MNTRTAQARQRGAATLVVVLVLFFVISLAAAYASRNLIFEQRTSNNQLRSTQALEVAEAGMEWALSLLNHGRIDANCEPSTSTADTSFRERYLVVDTTGRIQPALQAGVGELSAGCVAIIGGGWTCSCPLTAAVTLPAPSTTQVVPAFRVRFFRAHLPDPVNGLIAKYPGIVRIHVVGCTRNDPSCLDFDATVTGTFNEGRAVVRSNLALVGGPSSPPQVPLLAKGAITITAPGISAFNTLPNGSGFTIHAGGAVNLAGVATAQGKPGSPPGSDTVISNDATLTLPDIPAPTPPPVVAPYSSADRMFAAVFNMRPDTFRLQQGAIELPCPVAGCSASRVRDVAALNPWRPIWLSGGGLLMDSAGDIGSATRPVLIVANGSVQWTASTDTIFGVVYTRTPTWTLQGGGRITGAAIAEGGITGSGTTSFVFDPAVLQLVRWNSGSFVRMPGSWKDFQQ